MPIAMMLSELLAALGFDQMAADARTETETDRLQRYARVVLKNTPPSHKEAIRSRLAILRLV